MWDESAEECRALVLGMGNILLTDEGIGVHVIEHLRTHHERDDVRYLDGGTLSFTLASDLEAAEYLIVVDAAELHAAPGTMQCFYNDAMDRFLGKPKLSVHEVSLLDLLDMCRLTDQLPSRRALIGIQPDNLDWGRRPSAALAPLIPDAAARVLSLLEEWSPLS